MFPKVSFNVRKSHSGTFPWRGEPSCLPDVYSGFTGIFGKEEFSAREWNNVSSKGKLWYAGSSKQLLLWKFGVTPTAFDGFAGFVHPQMN